MPRTPSRKRTNRRGPRRASSSAPEFMDTPRLITSEEKRELILAHAASRAPRDPVQQASLWAGVLIAVLTIGIGWWATVGQQVRRSVQGTNLELQALTDELRGFTDEVQNNPVVNPPRLPGPTSEAEAAQFSFMLQEVLQGSTTTEPERRNDLLAPAASASSTAATSTPPSDAPSNPLPFIHPTSPGLSPDQSQY